MRAVLIASLAAMVVSAGAGAQASAGAPEVVASGRGEMRIAPTLASLTVSVTTRAQTAADAATSNASRLAAAISAIRAAGVSPEDIATLGYNVGQNYDYGAQGRRPTGFVARNMVRVEVRRLDDLGRIIDAALAGGATEVSSVQFSTPTTAAARRDALAAAVIAARADAEAMAVAAGGRLGRVISVTSGGGNFPMQRDYMGDVVLTSANSPAPTTNIAPRDLTIVATVTARWEFVAGNR